MAERINVAFGHQSRSGKSTAARYLMSHGYRHLSIAEPVYKIHNMSLEYLGYPVAKTPMLLQLIGEGYRNAISPDIWIDRACDEIRSIGNWRIVIDDLRYKNEAERLKALGFILIKIVRNDRPIDRDQTHKSEVDLADYPFDYVIENDGTIDDLHAAIDKVFIDVQRKQHEDAPCFETNC
jgi:hypothetical protein